MSGRLILIAEDDPAIRRVLQDALGAAGYEVLAAPDGRKALELLLSRPVELALLDVNMPEVNGFKLLRIMQKECPGTPSILVTAHGEEQERVRGLELGADDYVVKPFSIAELLARVAAVLRRYPGRPVAVGQVLSFPGGSLNGETHSATDTAGRDLGLTEREFELFRYFLSHPDRLLPQEEILLRVWGNNSSAAKTRTVAVTLTRLREKLPSEAAERFENMRGRGYRWKS